MRKTRLLKVAMCASLSLIAAMGIAQATTTIVATPGSSSGSEITVKLEQQGNVQDVSGYSFKLEYDVNQVEVVSVKDISGQPRAGTQISLGQPSIEDSGTTAAQRIILATTASNLVKPSKLAEVKLVKKPGYTGPLYLRISDRTTTPKIDGLLGADFNNIPHDFDVSQVNK